MQTQDLYPGTVRRQITEHKIDGKPLGRHVNHDPRSRNFQVRPRAATATSQRWNRVTPVLDQGNVGSCTGNASDGVLGTEPIHQTVIAAVATWDFGESGAVEIYSRATKLDSLYGDYPPEDTGSDGLSAAKACVQLGLISGYQHCLGLDAVVTALQSGPLITGVNWYSSFDKTAADGLVTISADASIRGGHEFELFGVDMERQLLWAYQSWGPTWGLNGTFCFSFTDYERLLDEQGDATVFVPLSQPAPTPSPPALTAADHVLLATATDDLRQSKPWQAWVAAKGL